MKKTRFTLIDALIILAVILVAAVAVIKLMPSGNRQNGSVEFTVMADYVDAGSGDLVKVGDKVWISYSETTEATVTAVEEEEYIEREFNKQTGKYVSYPVKGKSDLKITMECDASISDTAIENEKTPIRVGNFMPVRNKGYVFNGYVIEMEEKITEGDAE